MSVIDNITQWACGLKYDDIPARVIEKAKLQILNTIAAVLSGKYAGGLEKADFFNLPDGPATIIASGKKTRSEYAAFINALYSMSFDFDDYLFMGHTAHSSVLVSLAIAEEKGFTLKDVIVAQVIANEVEGRLGASVLLGYHNGQMWSYIHLAGSAIAAAKLLGLSTEQTASAIALALYQPNYPLVPGFMISDSKLLTASLPILSGMICAKLAQIGFHGNTDILETENGFLSRFAYLPLPHMLSGLGEWWVTDTIAFKPYPGCAYIDTAVDSTYKIMNEYMNKMGKPLKPSHIKQVDVFANILTMGMNALSERYDDGTLHSVNINFSIPRSIALTLIHNNLSAEYLSPTMILQYADEIKSLSKRIRLYHDWKYTLKMIATFYRFVGSGFLLKDTTTFELIKAFHSIRKDQPRFSLNVMGLLKAWQNLSDEEKMLIKDGIRKKSDTMRINEFTFSFGAKVIVETRDGITYEAESIVPGGASSADQKVVVINKLAHAIGDPQKAKILDELLIPTMSVKEFVKAILS